MGLPAIESLTVIYDTTKVQVNTQTTWNNGWGGGGGGFKGANKRLNIPYPPIPATASRRPPNPP